MPEDIEVPGGSSPIEETKPTPARRVSSKKITRPAETLKNSPEELPAPTLPAEEPAQAPKKNSKRRRRGKSKSSQTPKEDLGMEQAVNLTAETPTNTENKETEKPKENLPAQPLHNPAHKQRPRLDPERVAKNAWKIFLAEVSEEGVALIGDNDARELARRCFRLSEIFLDEAQRRS